MRRALGQARGERAVAPGRRAPDRDSLHIRALEAYAEASLRVGGTELATAERSARDLVARAPFRESGYRVLMEALGARGNTGEALRGHDGLVRLLSDELGVVPSRPARELHARLLRSAG